MAKSESRARARTIARMKNLVVASSVIAGCKDSSSSNGSIPTGYAVVDPMPRPADCPGIANLGKTSAKWKRVLLADGGDGWAIELTVTLPENTKPNFANARALTPPATTKLLHATPTTATYELRSTSTYTTLSIPIDCSARDGSPPQAEVRVGLVYSKPGEPLVPTLQDW